MFTAQVGCAMKSSPKQCQNGNGRSWRNIYKFQSVCVCVCVALKMFGLYEDIKVFYNKAKREIIHSAMCGPLAKAKD